MHVLLILHKLLLVIAHVSILLIERIDKHFVLLADLVAPDTNLILGLGTISQKSSIFIRPRVLLILVDLFLRHLVI